MTLERLILTQGSRQSERRSV
jgi:hypothetical protein